MLVPPVLVLMGEAKLAGLASCFEGVTAGLLVVDDGFVGVEGHTFVGGSGVLDTGGVVDNGGSLGGWTIFTFTLPER
jgi:hypothetical protein